MNTAIDAIDFIKDELRELVKQFPLVSCQYEYHAATYTHFIVVCPYHITQDEKYLEYEEQLVNRFEKAFTDDIAFLTERSIYKITNQTFSIIGALA